MGVLQLVKDIRSPSSTCRQGRTCQDRAAALDHAVASLGQIPAHGLGERLPTANAPAERPVELRHARRQNLERDTVLACPLTRQAHQVLGKPHPAKFRQSTDPHHPIDGNRHRTEADLPLGQVDMADDAAIDFGQETLIGSICRVGAAPKNDSRSGPWKTWSKV